jgi:tetratricopeptide (TPR) repeat protein
MRIRRLLFSALILVVSASCFAIPKVLIVEISTDPNSSSSLLLSDALAQALMEEGKSDPIVWSQTDPVFRDAMLDGRVPTTDKPTPNDVLQAQKALDCEYVIFTRSELKGTAVSGRIDMYKGTKSIWNNVESFDPKRSLSIDLENAMRSVARTWALRISIGPLKSVKAEPRPPAMAAPSQGQIPKSPSADPIPRVTDSTKAISDYKALMIAKKVSEATNLLRQAIDTAPMDVKLRIQMIRHLQEIGRGREAAEEARRASALLPDDPELRAIAAQAYIDSGQTDQAESQLNEALARNPEDPSTRLMLADIALNSLKTQAAIEHIDAARKKAPSKDLAYRVALCDAIEGNASAVQSDLTQAGLIGIWSGTPEETYRFCMRILGKAMEQSIGDLRSLHQRASVKPDDPEVATAIDEQLAIVQARQLLVDTWKAPSAYQKSQGILSLAMRLLSQSLSELKAFLSDGSKDTLTDANIDFGESIKQLSAARDALAAEQGNVARDGSTTVYSHY